MTILLNPACGGNCSCSAHGTVFVGGSFTAVNGNTAHSRLVRIDGNGEVDTTFLPVLDQAVYCLLYHEDTDRLYVGGEFSTVNGSTRERLACLDARTGALVSGFNANITAFSSEGVTQMVVDETNSRLWFVGEFDNIDGDTTRTVLGCVDLATGAHVSGYPTVDSIADGFAIFKDGTTIYVGGSFTGTVTGSNGSFSRNRCFSFNLSTFAINSFNPNLNGNCNGIALLGSTLFLGGTFTTVNGGTGQVGWAAVNPTTGTLLHDWPENNVGSFKPIVLANEKVYHLGSHTFAKDETNTFVARRNFSRYSETVLDALAPQFTPDTGVPTFTACVHDGALIVGGDFTAVNGISRSRIVSMDEETGELNDWAPVFSSRVRSIIVDTAA